MESKGQYRSKWKYKEKKKNCGRYGKSETHFDLVENSVTDATVKHPSHLRGKEIGLFYAKLSKQNRRKRAAETRPRVHLSSQRITNVNQYLSCYKPPLTCKSSSDDWREKYGSINSSSFKENFFKTLHGNETTHFGKEVPMSDIQKGLLKNPKLDEEYFRELVNKEADPQYQSILENRKKLSIYEKSDEIVAMIKKHQAVVISGETGCGKSTQVAQFLLDDAIKQNNGSTFYAICTQPRRIAAISVAQRVAEERCEPCGKSSNSVGYQIRLERRLPRPRGSILYCTTGILIQYLQSNPFLENVSHLLIDEVHERDILSDFILTVMRDLLPKRPDLRMVLMSATINAEMFSSYFHNCPILHVPGLSYPIEEYYLEDILTFLDYRMRPTVPKRFRDKKNDFNQKDIEYTQFIVPYVEELETKRSYPCHVLKSLRMTESEESPEELVMELIQHICTKERPGAILVFLPGWEQISRLHKRMSNDRLFSTSRFLILPLHSMMPTVNQRQIFDRPPKGVRKIILSTNIAETSLTIDDIVYVIDSGKIKQSNFDMSRNIDTLQVEWISKANAQQRKGRAGRVQAGVCYRMYSRARAQSFMNHPLPEMQRTRLEEVILQIKILKLGKVERFLQHVPEPPDSRTVEISLRLLITLGALDSAEHLTPLGFHLAQLPTDPRTGKLILMGAIFGCLQPILSIAAILSFKDPFVVPLNKEDLVRKTKKLLAGDVRSDHLLMARIMQEYEAMRKRSWAEAKNYCYKNFLSSSTMSMLLDMVNHFARHLYERQFISSPSCHDPMANTNKDNNTLILAVLCAGLFPNIAEVHVRPLKGKQHRIRNSVVKISTPEDGRISIHPKSLNYDVREFTTSWLVYYCKVKTTSIFLHDCSEISPFALLFFGEKVERKQAKANVDIVHIDKNISFCCDSKTAEVIENLRKHFDKLLSHRVAHPGPTDWSPESHESNLLKAIISVVTADNSDDFNQSFQQNLAIASVPSSEDEHEHEELEHEDSESGSIPDKWDDNASD